MEQTLAGTVIAITGGARGIGRSTALALAAKGARIAIGDLDLDLAKDTAAEVGGGAAAFALDVTDRQSFADFVDNVEAELGPIDVLVNNAGIMPIGPLADEADSITDKMIAINLTGVITGCKLMIPRMTARGAGHLVNIASMYGKVGGAGAATYCATKFGVVGLSESLRSELRGTGVRVSVVMPALVQTELAAGVPSVRGVPDLYPEDIANAIVSAVEKGTFDVFVPSWGGILQKVVTLFPRAVQDLIVKAMNSDHIMLEHSAADRESYVKRVGEGVSV